MLIKEYERIQAGAKNTKVSVNLEAIDVLSDHQPKPDVEADTKTCVAVMRCGLVLHLKAPKASLLQAMSNYRG